MRGTIEVSISECKICKGFQSTGSQVGFQRREVRVGLSIGIHMKNSEGCSC